MNKAQSLLAALVAVLTLTGNGCGGGYGAILSPPLSYTLGGTVSGLTGSGLVLQNNGVANGSTIARAANGTYPDLTGDRLANGTAYNVTVKTQPTNPSQTCVVMNGMGTIDFGVCHQCRRRRVDGHQWLAVSRGEHALFDNR